MPDMAILFSLLYVIQDFTKSTRMDFFFAISKTSCFFSYIVNMLKKLETGNFLRNFLEKYHVLGYKKKRIHLTT